MISGSPPPNPSPMCAVVPIGVKQQERKIAWIGLPRGRGGQKSRAPAFSSERAGKKSSHRSNQTGKQKYRRTKESPTKLEAVVKLLGTFWESIASKVGFEGFRV